MGESCRALHYSAGVNACAPGSWRVHDPARRRMYRAVFLLAGVYNLAFGAWAVLWPLEFFRLAGIAPPRYPALWSCLGMVVGVYGLLYLHAARYLERGRPAIAVGLLGKLCGPLGFVHGVLTGAWPLQTLPLIVFNDLTWWAPFGLYLLEGRRLGAWIRRHAPALCAAMHAAATLAMVLVLMPGTEVVTAMGARADYIAAHLVAWRLGWGLWILSGLSLLGFYAWWGARCTGRWTAALATGLAAAGFGCDAFAEALYISRLPADLAWVGPLGTTLTAGVANGLYTLAGVILTLRCPRLSPRLRAAAWLVWVAGAAMTASALVGSRVGMLVSSGVLFPLFTLWCLLVGRALGEEPGQKLA